MGDGDHVVVSTIEDALKALVKGSISRLISDWNLDPQARRQGPHADTVVKKALEMGISVDIASSTDDSSGILAANYL